MSEQAKKESRIIPAVDIRNGRCVRLLQGDYSREKTYSDDPVSVAKRWDIDGVSFIHVVDLDGAREGRPVNCGIIAKIARTLNAKIEVGGGIRNEKDSEILLAAGAARMILGTTICEFPEKAKDFVRNFGADKIIAGIDARNGIAATRGWTGSSGADPITLSAKFADAGIVRIIYTDISADGMLGGPNISAVYRLCAAVPQVKIISSGGISSLEDIRCLFSGAPANLEAAIIGKALYEEKFSLEDAVATDREMQ